MEEVSQLHQLQDSPFHWFLCVFGSLYPYIHVQTTRKHKKASYLMEHYTIEQYLFLQRETASFLKHNLDKNWKRNLVLRLVLSVSKFKEKYQFLHTLFANSLPFCNILSQREMTYPICAFSSSASFCKPSPPCPNLYPDGRGDFCSSLLKSMRWVSSVSSFFPFLQVLCFIPCFL